MTFDTDLERRLTDVLHERAETAMSRTDTEGHLLPLLDDIESSASRRRTVWGLSAAAAAAAVVVALLLTGVPGLSSDDAENRVPAGPRTPVGIATHFVEAFAAYDSVEASRDLALGADMKIWKGTGGTWQRRLVWADAVGFTMLPGDCATQQRLGSRTLVSCPFDMHSLGSDRIGRGPYHDNVFYVVVDDGEIVTTEMVVPSERNGFADEMWDPFTEWLEREYPADFAVMVNELLGTGRAARGVLVPYFTDDSIARWRTRMVSWLAVNHALDTAPSSAG